MAKFLVVALAASASALAPQQKPATQTRRELGAGLMSAIGPSSASGRFADAGGRPGATRRGFAPPGPGGRGSTLLSA